MCRNFGKEPVILFPRTAAAPRGHMASIIKRSSTGDSLSLSFGSTTNTVNTGPFRSSPLTAYLFGTFHTRDPRATNARAELKGTGHIQLSSSRHLSANPFYPTLPYQTYFTLQLNLTKPYHLSESCELFFELLLTHSLFIPFGVKPCLLLLLLLYINFVARISSSSSFLQKLSPSQHCCLSTVYSFTKRRNKPGFSGLIKIPTGDVFCC